MGRITVGATGPGTGKTMTLREYCASTSNCWIGTMRHTDKSVNAMMAEVLRALGVPAKGTGWGRQMSHMVSSSVAGKRGLLVIDEANHLTWESLEEIRAWHDDTGVGVCLLGNEELLMRIQGGPRRDAFARLNSRIAQSHIQNLPVEEDVEAFCDAWELADPAVRSMLSRIALTPGAGGLRECRQIVEQASMLAADEDRPLAFADLRDAQAGRATKHIRTS
nr:AAA family ATPase [Sphingomonas sp. CROZ-RG-20F-R02-07]